VADNAFIGFIQLAGTLASAVQTVGANDVPTDADSAPTYRIYGPAGTLMTNGTGTTTIMDSSNTNGLYRLSHSISSGDGYAAGSSYTIVYSWAISSSLRGAVQTFTVT
jgi:hypothetical protein